MNNPEQMYKQADVLARALFNKLDTTQPRMLIINVVSAAIYAAQEGILNKAGNESINTDEIECYGMIIYNSILTMIDMATLNNVVSINSEVS